MTDVEFETQVEVTATFVRVHARFRNKSYGWESKDFGKAPTRGQVRYWGRKGKSILRTALTL